MAQKGRKADRGGAGLRASFATRLDNRHQRRGSVGRFLCPERCGRRMVISRGRALAGYWPRREQKVGALPSDLGPSESEAGGSLGLGKGSSSPRAAPLRRKAGSRSSWSVLQSGERG